MPLWFRVLRIWLPIAVAVTATMSLTYIAVQQQYRNGLDDPQLQLAIDGAARLDAGASPQSLATSPSVDADKSLAPFLIVFSGGGEVLASGATLAGGTPKPPAGVLAAARSKGTSRVTWQPRPGVRLASVSAATRDGRVVLAARNMRAVESRVDDLTSLATLAWGAALAGVLIATLLAELVGLRLDKA